MKINSKNFILLVFSMIFLSSSAEAEMTSPSYNIKSDVISVGGIRQSSDNYFSEESIGEMGTGESRSASYISEAGFWAMVGDDDVLTLNITDNTADLGTLARNLVKSDTAAFRAATTARSGYVIEVFGNSLSSSSHTITPLSSPGLLPIDNEQFGLNLRSNISPAAVGYDPSGGSGQAASGYSTPDSYKFSSGDIIAQSVQQSVYTDYTISFISGIASASDAGDYSANLTAVITGKF